MLAENPAPLLVADFHVHTSASHDGAVDSAEVARVARSRGLTAIAICDHGAIGGALAAREAASDDLLVVVGEEIRTTEGEIIGYFLARCIENGLTPEETVSAIHEQGGAVCVPHPFDRYRRSPLTHEALGRIAEQVDLIEGFNARNLRDADNRAAAEWAAARDIPVLAGSDAHTRGEIGNVRVEVPAFADAAGLISAARGARLHTRGAGVLPHIVTAWVKRVGKH